MKTYLVVSLVESFAEDKLIIKPMSLGEIADLTNDMKRHDIPMSDIAIIDGEIVSVEEVLHGNGWVIGTPHFVNSENCMGDSERYWRVWADNKEEPDKGKRTVCGVGISAEQAIADCEKKIKERR